MFNISTLDNYCTFIASRHFENIDDFINLEMSTSKFNGNMTKLEDAGIFAAGSEEKSLEPNNRKRGSSG